MSNSLGTWQLRTRYNYHIFMHNGPSDQQIVGFIAEGKKTGQPWRVRAGKPVARSDNNGPMPSFNGLGTFFCCSVPFSGASLSLKYDLGSEIKC
jgi:hypothetical protein